MIEQRKMTTGSWGLLLLLGLVWGGSFMAIKLTLSELSPEASVLYRTALGALMLWAVILVTRPRLPRSGRVWVYMAVMGFLNNIIPFTLMAWAQLHIETGLTSILNSATAFWGVILAALFFKDERLLPRKLFGVLLAAFGVAVVIGLAHLTTFSLRNLAQLAVLLGTIFYAFASIWARKMLGGITPIVAACGMLSGSAVISLFIVLYKEGNIPIPVEATTWGALLYISWVATAFAYLLYYKILAHAGSGNLMLVTLIVPPISIWLGATFLYEALPTRVYIGTAIIALGLILLDGRLFKQTKNHI
jgi:drug/metabolite transporter (DMT)-like permease